MPLALVISFAACPSVSSSIFQSWLCQEYQFDGRDEDDVTFYSYLRSDISIRCSEGGYTDPEHNSIKAIASALVFVW